MSYADYDATLFNSQKLFGMEKVWNVELCALNCCSFPYAARERRDQTRILDDKITF